jgi:hypothetical protein
LAERTHVVNMVKAGRNTSATTQFVRLQTNFRDKSMQEAIIIAFMSTKPSPYQTSSIHCCNDAIPAPSLASRIRLPAAGHPAAQPSHALAPRPQSMVVIGTQSVFMTRQATGGQSDLCQHMYSYKPLQNVGKGLIDRPWLALS